MDFLTGAILSGVIYDMIKHEIVLSVDNFKDKLKGWVVDDITMQAISNEISKLELTDDLSELAIKKKVLASPEIKILIEKIQPVSSENIIIQNHSGSGDNVGRNKIIH